MIIHEQEDGTTIVFDDALVTAEMYVVASTAYNYYADLFNVSKEDVTVTDRIRSGETTWLFECCAALFRFRNSDGSLREYDVLSHREMKTILMGLPHTIVPILKGKVEFFFQLPVKSLSEPKQPSRMLNIVALAERLLTKNLDMTTLINKSS